MTEKTSSTWSFKRVCIAALVGMLIARVYYLSSSSPSSLLEEPAIAVPSIDISPFLLEPSNDQDALLLQSRKLQTAQEIREACRTVGFFYIHTHNIDETLQRDLEEASRLFFALPDSEKADIDMSKGGAAWRGWFHVGGELTSGRPDVKEGIYFAREETAQEANGEPMHGANLFPLQPSQLKPLVLRYMDACETLGHALMRAVSVALGYVEDEEFFRRTFQTPQPLYLFRIFNYPLTNVMLQRMKQKEDGKEFFGVAEHTDYGVLTILKTDSQGGLQVKTLQEQWIDVPPRPNEFVINIGDMLERMTDGYFISTPHRVRKSQSILTPRLSFPFFFDPAFHAEMKSIPVLTRDDSDNNNKNNQMRRQRWDNMAVEEVHGSYKDYLLHKVGKVFPELAQDTSIKQKQQQQQQ